MGSHVLVTSMPDGSTDTEVHLLGANSWQLLGAVPDILTVDRFTHGGGTAGLVASASPSIELLIGIDLATGVAATMWPTPLALTSSLGNTSTGTLAAGFGLAGGPFLFAAFPQPLDPTLLAIPTGHGFFLAR
jgi:hypothetical protein